MALNINGKTALETGVSSVAGESTLIHSETTQIHVETSHIKAMVGASNAATNATSMSGRLSLIHKEATGISQEVLLRFAQSGSKTISSAADKTLTLDSGTAHAEIVSITVNGLVSSPWTVKYFIPAIDAVVAENASELRVVETYTTLSTAGGQIGSFGMPYNCLINFKNDAAADAYKISQVSVLYRSSTTLTISWEA